MGGERSGRPPASIYAESQRQDAHMALVVAAIASERKRQTMQWSKEHDDRHSPAEWLTLIADFLGRAAHDRFRLEDDPAMASKEEYRAQLVRLGAVVVAAIEAHDRRFGAQ